MAKMELEKAGLSDPFTPLEIMGHTNGSRPTIQSGFRVSFQSFTGLTVAVLPATLEKTDC